MTSIEQTVSCLDGYDPNALRVDRAAAAIRTCLAPVRETETLPIRHALGREGRSAWGGSRGRSRCMSPRPRGVGRSAAARILIRRERRRSQAAANARSWWSITTGTGAARGQRRERHGRWCGRVGHTMGEVWTRSEILTRRLVEPEDLWTLKT